MKYAIVTDPESQKEGRIGRIVHEDKGKNEVVLCFGDSQLPIYYRFPCAKVEISQPRQVGLFTGVLHTIPYGKALLHELRKLPSIGLSAEGDGNARQFLIRQAVRTAVPA